jgi:GAF domain-containing protein
MSGDLDDARSESLPPMGDPDFDDLQTWNELERLGRALHVKEADLPGTLQAILINAVDVIDGADLASINLMLGRTFVPQAVLGAKLNELDAFQKQQDAGPCIDASRDQVVIHIPEMKAEQRWPEYAELAVSRDIHSMLCMPLWVDKRRLGSISLYAHEPEAFGQRQERLANLLAALAALALVDAERTENLRIGLRNRDVIGQAKGILMERHRITADAAFAMLSEASQRLNRKLVVVAEDVASTGHLPSPSAADPA